MNILQMLFAPRLDICISYIGVLKNVGNAQMNYYRHCQCRFRFAFRFQMMPLPFISRRKPLMTIISHFRIAMHTKFRRYFARHDRARRFSGDCVL